MMSVYALVDPRHPNDMRYVGRTAVSPHKRTRDHISQARFRRKHGGSICDVMAWILLLEKDGVEPEFRVLGEYADETAHGVERFFIDSLPELLNDKSPQSLRGGKPKGMKDTPAGLANKRRASSQQDTRDIRSARNTAINQRRRKEQGFPFPALPAYHRLNRPHFKVLRAQQAAPNRIVTKIAEWRAEMNFPRPDQWLTHRENRRHVPAMSYREWSAAREV